MPFACFGVGRAPQITEAGPAIVARAIRRRPEDARADLLQALTWVDMEGIGTDGIQKLIGEYAAGGADEKAAVKAGLAAVGNNFMPIRSFYPEVFCGKDALDELSVAQLNVHVAQSKIRRLQFVLEVNLQAPGSSHSHQLAVLYADHADKLLRLSQVALDAVLRVRSALLAPSAKMLQNLAFAEQSILAVQARAAQPFGPQVQDSVDAMLADARTIQFRLSMVIRAVPRPTLTSEQAEAVVTALDHCVGVEQDHLDAQALVAAVEARMGSLDPRQLVFLLSPEVLKAISAYQEAKAAEALPA